MGLVSGIVLYILLWWWVLFMVLPIKASPPKNIIHGHATSAPDNPYILKKIISATIISSLLWLLAFYIVSLDIISFR